MSEKRIITSDWKISIGGGMVPIFKKNTPFPTEEKEIIIKTAFNNQTSIEFHVFKGTSIYNWYILKIQATKIRTDIKLYCKIDENGIFLCRGTDENKILQISSISSYYKRLLSEEKYYDILGIDENVSQVDINNAFTLKSAKFKPFPEINQIISAAYTNTDTEDKRKRLYLRNVVIDIFREWKIDQHKDKIPFLVDKLTESENRDRDSIKKNILDIEKPLFIIDMHIGEKGYILITTDEGRDGTTLLFTKEKPTGKKETLKISIPPNTLPDKSDEYVTITINGEGISHAYIPNLKGDAKLKIKVVQIDVNDMFRDIQKELKTNFKNCNQKDQKDIINIIREEVHSQYQEKESVNVNKKRIINKFMDNIRKYTLPISLTKDEIKEGKNIPLETEKDSIHIMISPDNKDGDMVHIKNLSFVQVREIPIDANEIFEDIKEKLKIDSFGHNKDIIRMIRGEIHNQYRESGLKNIGISINTTEKKITQRIMENKDIYHRSGCAGVNKKAIVNKIISMLPPPIVLDITLKEAIFGSQRRGALTNPKCEKCNGTGFIKPKPDMQDKISCIMCNGMGFIARGICTLCDGKGFISNTLFSKSVAGIYNNGPRCSCYIEINIKIPPIKTLLSDHTTYVKDAQILIKSKIMSIL